MPDVPRQMLGGIDFKAPLVYYAFVSLLFLLSLYLMQRIVDSPLGKILQAIRENEVRAAAVGYNVPRFKLAAFVIGGAFSGAAGGLFPILFRILPLGGVGFGLFRNLVFSHPDGRSRP